MEKQKLVIKILSLGCLFFIQLSAPFAQAQVFDAPALLTIRPTQEQNFSTNESSKALEAFAKGCGKCAKAAGGSFVDGLLQTADFFIHDIPLAIQKKALRYCDQQTGRPLVAELAPLFEYKTDIMRAFEKHGVWPVLKNLPANFYYGEMSDLTSGDLERICTAGEVIVETVVFPVKGGVRAAGKGVHSAAKFGVAEVVKTSAKEAVAPAATEAVPYN